MKYILYSSKQLFFMMITISLLIILSSSNFFESFKQVGIPANGLTNHYFSFSIGENRDKIVEKDINLESMISFLKGLNKNFLLLKESDSNILGVYFYQYKFEPKIVEGRNFSKEDFESRTNTIIVDYKLKDKCVEKDGKLFYKFDVNYFEVIGFFEPVNNSVNKDAKAYYNLASKNLKSIDRIYDNYIYGTFCLDVGMETANVVSMLDEYCSLKILRSNIDNTFYERLQKAISTEKVQLSSLVLIMFMIILNSINVLSNWLEKRKKEIFVRKMVGATDKKIYLLLVKDFIFILTFSYIIVALLFIFIDMLNILTFFNFSLQTIIVSYLTVFLTGLITIILMIFSYNNIIKIRR